jgi:hypothetical protein
MEAKDRVVKQLWENFGQGYRAKWRRERAVPFPARVKPGGSPLLLLPSAVAKGPACESIAFAAGFRWLLGYIALSLVAARLVYWEHAWTFTWVPEELTGALVHYFLGFHLVIAPLSAFGVAVVCEMGKIRRGEPGRAPWELLRACCRRTRS